MVEKLEASEIDESKQQLLQNLETKIVDLQAQLRATRAAAAKAGHSTGSSTAAGNASTDAAGASIAAPGDPTVMGGRGGGRGGRFSSGRGGGRGRGVSSWQSPQSSYSRVDPTGGGGRGRGGRGRFAGRVSHSKYSYSAAGAGGDEEPEGRSDKQRADSYDGINDGAATTEEEKEAASSHSTRGPINFECDSSSVEDDEDYRRRSISLSEG